MELHLVAHEGEKLFWQAIAQSVYRAPLFEPEQLRVSAGGLKALLFRWISQSSHSLCSTSTPSRLDVGLARSRSRRAWRVYARPA